MSFGGTSKPIVPVLLLYALFAMSGLLLSFDYCEFAKRADTVVPMPHYSITSQRKPHMYTVVTVKSMCKLALLVSARTWSL